MSHYEFGVRGWCDDANGDPNVDDNGPHRRGMTQQEAEQWVQECLDMGARPGAFIVIRREVSDWQDDPEATDDEKAARMTTHPTEAIRAKKESA